MKPRAPSSNAPADETALSVTLHYEFSPTTQRGAALGNPLVALLEAVREAGSIAQAAHLLDCSYRHIWGTLRRWETTFGEPLVSWTQGQPARLTPFGERLLWAELRARTRMQPHIDALRADLTRMVAEARDPRQQLLTVHASHDLALPRLREHAERHAALHLDMRFMGSIDSLRSLNAGRCLVAGFHVPALRGAAPHFAAELKPLLHPGQHKLIGCARRTQGLMLRREDAARVRSLADLPQAGTRFVNRQQGSGTRLLMDHLMLEYGLAPAQLPGYDSRVEESHVAVAATIASGAADVGPGVEAAALEFGLHFVPLVQEDYFLACLKPNLDSPAVQRLRDLLADAAWARILTDLPGYRPAAAPGKVLMMTQALPWWHYAQPKAGIEGANPAKASKAVKAGRVRTRVD
ncbi:MAG TPA: substrate-binding domain-containing protein [Rubrivivax sp.]|nr:substrate-binding domain-containing protein [Rubrivivax sp.]